MSDGSVKVNSPGELSDLDNENCSSSGGETRRTCVDCGTFRTPLWRGGPAGPKSLCNACGIKSRKKRHAAARGMKPEEKKKKRNRESNSSDSDLSFDHRNAKRKINKCDDDLSSSSSNEVSKDLDLDFKVPAIEKKRLWKKLGEEERAAVLLMSLSCGSVYA